MESCCLFVSAVALASAVAAAAPPSYTLLGSYQLPAAVSAFDPLPDGRVITIVGDSFWTQDAVNSSSWTRAGSLGAGLISSFGASFVRVSPDGATVAVGDNNFGAGARVHTLAFASLDPNGASATTAWPAANLDAHWASESRLYVSGAGVGGEVREINIAAESSRVVLNNIGLSAGGVASSSTHLFAGNGFDLGGGPSSTGEVRAFAWSDITSSTGALDFASGIPVAAALSGASLDFDPLGNLCIGGGDVFTPGGEFGFASVVDGAAVAAALAGGPAAPDSAEERLSPHTLTDSYFTRFNHATNELLVTYFDNSAFQPGATVFRYAIPEPGIIGLAAIACAPRRRRHTTIGNRAGGDQ